MCKEKATRNGNGNSRLAEQLGIIRGKNIGKKTAYLKCHNLMPEVLPELFKSCNLQLAARRRLPSQVPGRSARSCRCRQKRRPQCSSDRAYRRVALQKTFPCFWAVPFRRAAFFLCVRIPGTEILRRRKTDGKKRRKSWRKVCCFDKFRLFCNRVKKRPGT